MFLARKNERFLHLTALLFVLAATVCPSTRLPGQQVLPPVGGGPYLYKDPFTGAIESRPHPRMTSSNLDETKLNAIARILDDRDADDTGKVTTPQQIEARENKRQSMIKNDPDLGPYLIELANERIRSKNNGIGNVFYAMSFRSDIDAFVISGYIDKANTMMSEGSVVMHGNNGFEAEFLDGLAFMLKSHSPKGEDFLIRMIRTQDNAICKLSAAAALARTGSTRALPAMLEASKWMSRQAKEAPWSDNLAEDYLKKMNVSLETLRERLNAENK